MNHHRSAPRPVQDISSSTSSRDGRRTVPFARPAWLALAVCCGTFAAQGCARETAATTTPSSESESESTSDSASAPSASSAASDAPGSTESVAGTAGVEEGSGSGAVAEAADPTPPPAAADAPTAEPTRAAPVEVDMTPAAAAAICASLADEPDSVGRCAFLRGGVTLPDGARADVLEFEFDREQQGLVVAAYLVVRIPIDEYPTTLLLGERTDEPGMSTTYSLGRLERTRTGVRIRVTDTSTIYPNTGDPSRPTGAEVERARYVATCTLDAETHYYDCARE